MTSAFRVSLEFSPASHSTRQLIPESKLEHVHLVNLEMLVKDLLWIWFGFELDLAWNSFGFGLDLVWNWAGFALGLGRIWAPYVSKDQ